VIQFLHVQNKQKETEKNSCLKAIRIHETGELEIMLEDRETPAPKASEALPKVVLLM
jgi:hypothetical protein